ncbi:uncharacterized protein V1510DRAFT_349507, partial [Dipodascopsis tothii]|uniref:uncharacterized protein n=1 Tax=Dipodascopsis tothii TaxID=44089 RepID=UPI0034CE8524
KKRRSKHAPQELSSKVKVGRHREIIEVPKIQRRDPRFEGLSGKFDESKFQKHYAFLDEYRQTEIGELQKQVKKEKDERQQEKLQRQLQSLQTKLDLSKKKQFERDVLREHKQKEKELVAQGKQPYFLKKSDKRNLILAKKFETMKKSDVDRAIKKRRKRNVAKERKNMPDRR